jgi:hypothetical protein
VTTSNTWTCSLCGALVWTGTVHSCGGASNEATANLPNRPTAYVNWPIPSASPYLDREIQAMGGIASALEPLDEGARVRVLDWAESRFGATPGLAQR